MGDSSLLCRPAPEGCCLELHETVLLLLALILVVQLALKLATVICYYFCCFVGNLCRLLTAKEPKKPPALPRTVKKVSPRKPSIQDSEEDLPHRRCRRSRSPRRRSQSPRRRCLQCTLEPVKVTMNLEKGHFRCQEHKQMRRHPYPDYPPCSSPRYYNCNCENRPRPRTSSAPSAYPTPCYRDVACGTSDLIVNIPADERRNVGMPLEPYPRVPVAETQRRSMVGGQEAEHSRRPARVYIYPVHPQTPPGSRSPTPERAHRRRAVAPDEQAEHEAHELRHRAREAEPPTLMGPQVQAPPGGPPRFHNVVSSIMQAGATPAEPGGGNTKRQPRAETPPGSEWVYRPLK